MSVLSLKNDEFDKFGCFSYKKIWFVTIPILISVLMEHVIGLTDTAFLGRIGEVELGASALAGVYYLAFFVLGFGFSVGAQILIARRNGEHHYGEIGKIVYVSGMFLFVLSILLCIFIRYASPWLMSLMVKSGDVYGAAVSYLDWRAYGLIFAFVSSTFRAFFVGITKTKILTYNALVMVLSNVVLNYALIFGKWGFPEMGIAGAAIASSIAELVSMVFYIIYIIKYVDLEKYGFNRIKSCFDVTLLKQVFRVSFWMMAQPFLAVSVWFVFFIAIEHLGERPLAVVNLARSLSAIPFIILNAFATSGNSLVSNLIGEHGVGNVFRLTRKVIFAGFVVVTPLLIFVAIFPRTVLMVYTNNVDLIEASVNTIYIMCIASFLQVPANIVFNIVSGTGAVKMAMIVEAITLAIYLVVVYYLIIMLRSTPAVSWTAEIVYQLSMLGLSVWYLSTNRWQNQKV